MTWPLAAVLIAWLAFMGAAWYVRELKTQRKDWAALVKSNEDNTAELKKTMAAVIKLGLSVKRLERVLELEESQAVARGEIEARDG